jgi:hypothetical protein
MRVAHAVRRFWRRQIRPVEGNFDFHHWMNEADKLYQAAQAESLRRIRERVADMRAKQDAKDEQDANKIKAEAEKAAQTWQKWIQDRIAGKPDEKSFNLDTAPKNFPGGQHQWEGLSDQQKAQALVNKGIHDEMNASMNAAAQKFIEQTRSTLQKAQDELAKLNTVRSRLTSSEYDQAKKKIVEDYAKTKEQKAPHDIGGADEYGTERVSKLCKKAAMRSKDCTIRRLIY